MTRESGALLTLRVGARLLTDRGEDATAASLLRDAVASVVALGLTPGVPKGAGGRP
ncbi:MAG: hypothetical protein ACREJF_05760 [Candidatus Methylomirabilales bacterium]